MTAYGEAHDAIMNVNAAANLLDTLISEHAELAKLDTTPLHDAIGGLSANLTQITPPPPMPLVSGLFVEGSASPVPDVVNTICNVGWDQLQATAGGPILANNPVDVWLGKGRVGHCRLFFGGHVPTYVLALAGTIKLHDTTDNRDVVVAPWWNPKVQAAQKDFVTKFAAKYDGKLSLVFMATPMTLYAEPMIRDIADANSRAALLGAGYTNALDDAAFHAMLDWFSAFKHTRLGLACNPKQILSPTSHGQDVAWTNAFIDTCRQRFGEQFHVQNNSVRVPMLGGDYPAMYAHMKGSKPLGFQLAIEARVGDYGKAIQWCIDQGAHSVELSPGFQNHTTAAQRAQWDAALRANA